MTITDRTRKLLWGPSGNRCAFCKLELSEPATATDPDAVLGEECHIRAQSKGGPRWDPDYPSARLDEYPNLVLLCANHHTLVDAQPGTYTVKFLEELKADHEAWVRARLVASPPATNAEDLPAVRQDLLSLHRWGVGLRRAILTMGSSVQVRPRTPSIANESAVGVAASALEGVVVAANNATARTPQRDALTAAQFLSHLRDRLAANAENLVAAVNEDARRRNLYLS